MNRLTRFTLRCCDAWRNYEKGIDSVLVCGSGVKIDFSINSEPFSLDLTDCEDAFNREVLRCGIEELNDKCFRNDWCLDGYLWSFQNDEKNITVEKISSFDPVFP